MESDRKSRGERGGTVWEHGKGQTRTLISHELHCSICPQDHHVFCFCRSKAANVVMSTFHETSFFPDVVLLLAYRGSILLGFSLLCLPLHFVWNWKCGHIFHPLCFCVCAQIPGGIWWVQSIYDSLMTVSLICPFQFPPLKDLWSLDCCKTP